jgi:hypothetical protein
MGIQLPSSGRKQGSRTAGVPEAQGMGVKREKGKVKFEKYYINDPTAKNITKYAIHPVYGG